MNQKIKPTIQERVRSFFSRHSPEKTAPKGQTPILRSDEVTTWNASFFGLTDPERVEVLKNYRKVYRSGGIVRTAIDTYTLFMFSGGWSLQSEDEDADTKDYFENVVFTRTVKNTFNQTLLQIAQDAIAVGDGYAKILRGSGQNTSPVSLQQLPGERILPHVDDTKNPLWYEIYDSNFAQKLGTFRLEDVLHVCFQPSGVEECGIGLLESAWDDIKRDLDTVEGSAAAIRRHGFGIWHVKVSSTDPEREIEPAEINEAQNTVKKLSSKTEIVTTGNIDILPLNETGQTNVTLYADWSVLRLCTALGIPGELLGLRQGTTDATAVTRIENFYKKIQTYQVMMAEAVNTQFIDNILRSMGKQPGTVWIEFADPTPEDNIKRAAYLQTLSSLTPGDPFAIMSREQMQTYLGIDHDQWAEDEEFREPENGEGISAY